MPALPPYIIEPIWEQFAPCCPKEKWIIRSAATGPASPTGWSSRSWFRYWSSAAPTRESPTGRARLPRCVGGATSGSRPG